MLAGPWLRPYLHPQPARAISSNESIGVPAARNHSLKVGQLVRSFLGDGRLHGCLDLFDEPNHSLRPKRRMEQFLQMACVDRVPWLVFQNSFDESIILS